MLVPDLLAYGLSHSPTRPCLIQAETRLTFVEVDDRAARATRAMIEFGIGRGDRVALLAANAPEFLELQVACQRTGAAFVPLNFRLALPELVAMLADCGPKLLIHGPGLADTAAKLNHEQVWHLGDDGIGAGYDELLAAFPPARLARAEWDVPAQILYTSGTTGTPKGVVVSGRALFGRIAALKSNIAIGVDDVLLQTLPLFHIASAMSFAFTMSGATCVTVRDFDAADVLQLCQAEQVTHTLTVPTMIQALVAAHSSFSGSLTSLRTVFYGASPISPELLTAALQTFGCDFAQLYGMTEAGIGVMLEPTDHDPIENPDLLAATGRDLAFYDTRVVRADGSSAAPGEVGEITITGPGMFDGYWNNTDATQQVLTGGWLHTGDAGFRDSAGYLFLVDRLKDMIITGGENVYCREVESVLAAYPGIREVAVIGLDDERWGQRVHAVLGAGADVELDQIDAFCRARLAGYKCPRSYEFVPALPRNATGKVLKHLLRGERAL